MRSAIRDRLPRGGEGGATHRIWSRDAEELAACFTVHGRDLFGYACVLTDADRPLAEDLIQAAFEAAAASWRTLRDRSAGQRYDWLRDTLAAAIQRHTGHMADRAIASPADRLTRLKMARFRADYDAVAGLDQYLALIIEFQTTVNLRYIAAGLIDQDVAARL